MATCIHERADGKLIEYRRFPWHPAVLHLQGRVLRPDGRPYDGHWYSTSDAELLRLQQEGSDVVEVLASAPAIK